MSPVLFPELTLSLDALRALQLERLRAALRHAYEHQAPYRAKCQAAGAHPDDLRTLDDLKGFPFTATSIRNSAPFTRIRASSMRGLKLANLTSPPRLARKPAHAEATASCRSHRPRRLPFFRRGLESSSIVRPSSPR